MGDPEILSALLGATGDDHASAAKGEPLLAELVAAARAAWPTLSLPEGVFVNYVGEKLRANVSTAVSLDETLRGLRVSDLYLACACVSGMPAAIAAFEAAYLADIASSLPRPRRGGLDEGEITQAVREKLLVRNGDRPPKLAEFSGQGDLKSWVRVVAVRTALNMIRGQRRLVALDDDALLAERAHAGDAEIAHLKKRYRVEFADAFHDALGTLATRDRNVLRQHYVDGLTMEQIGAIYRVHRITVVRWVDKARKALAQATRKRLSAKLHVGRPELESIMRLIQSQLDVSLRRYLK